MAAGLHSLLKLLRHRFGTGAARKRKNPKYEGIRKKIRSASIANFKRQSEERCSGGLQFKCFDFKRALRPESFGAEPSSQDDFREKCNAGGRGGLATLDDVP